MYQARMFFSSLHSICLPTSSSPISKHSRIASIEDMRHHGAYFCFENLSNNVVFLIKVRVQLITLIPTGVWVFEINCYFILRLRILIQKWNARNSVAAWCEFMRKKGSNPNYDPNLGSWKWGCSRVCWGFFFWIFTALTTYFVFYCRLQYLSLLQDVSRWVQDHHSCALPYHISHAYPMFDHVINVSILWWMQVLQQGITWLSIFTVIKMVECVCRSVFASRSIPIVAYAQLMLCSCNMECL